MSVADNVGNLCNKYVASAFGFKLPLFYVNFSHLLSIVL